MNKRTLILFIILIAVVVFALYYWISNESTKQEADGNVYISGDTTQIDLDFLDDENFKELKVYNDLPVRSGETGNFSLFGY